MTTLRNFLMPALAFVAVATLLTATIAADDAGRRAASTLTRPDTAEKSPASDGFKMTNVRFAIGSNAASVWWAIVGHR